MKIITLAWAFIPLVVTLNSRADPGEEKKPDSLIVTKPGKPPEMSEIPVMKEQGKRMATLMEKLQEIQDPAERKRIMAEAMCPQ